jgi:hypothetical protein
MICEKDPSVVERPLSKFLNRDNAPVLRLDAKAKALAAERIVEASKGQWDDELTTDATPRRMVGKDRVSP